MPRSFIRYDNLSIEDAGLFFGLNLNEYLYKATQILFKSRGGSKYRKREDLHFDQEKLKWLNSRIADVLELIGTNSNKGYTSSKMRRNDIVKFQDDFFQRPIERETFASHLIFSAVLEKTKSIGSRNQSKVSLIANTPLATVDKTLRDLRGGKRFYYGSNKLSEMEVRAIGVFYLTNLIFSAAKDCVYGSKSFHARENKIISLQRISYGMFSLINALDEYLSRAEGSRESNKDSEKLRDIVDRVAMKNRDIAKKEVIYLARAECKAKGVPFYKNDSAALKRIKILWERQR